MDEKDPRFQEALKNCDREPIHIPGGTQDFGLLVAADPDFGFIKFLSGNAPDAFGVEAKDLLGAPTKAVFATEEIFNVRSALSRCSNMDRRVHAGLKEIDGTLYELSAHLKDGRAIVEMFASGPSGLTPSHILEEATSFLILPQSNRTVQVLLEYAVERFRFISGFSRIKAYRFLPDYSGEVVAEATAGAMPSFLGLRFPAFDIPPLRASSTPRHRSGLLGMREKTMSPC